MVYQKYEDVLRGILQYGTKVPTGTRLSDGRQPHALSITGIQFRHELAEGFPAVSTKKLYWDSVVKELLWFLRGETNVKQLECKIWDSWADDDGECGPIYGKQFRRWGYEDGEWNQVDDLVKNLKAVVADPYHRARRRLVVSAWNAPDVPKMGLAPCHTLYQVLPVGSRLDMVCHWRSIDVFLGMPFNVASYALLNHILCEITGLIPGTLAANIADAHIYDNQVDAVEEQLQREPFPQPSLVIDPQVKALASDLSVEQCRLLTPEMFRLEGYQHHGPLKCRPEVAV